MHTHIGKQIDAFQMVGAQLYEQVQKQGMDGQLRKLVPGKVFIFHLYQKLVHVVVNLGKSGAGEMDGGSDNGPDPGEIM
jgi:hypothetical protein